MYVLSLYYLYPRLCCESSFIKGTGILQQKVQVDIDNLTEIAKLDHSSLVTLICSRHYSVGIIAVRSVLLIVIMVLRVEATVIVVILL